jgi:A/G-specific adenine glycosylase
VPGEAVTGGAITPPSDESVQQFVRIVLDHYARAPREMPWRSNPNPYWVFVSEVMLQQTQVPRVMDRFPAFVARFPDFAALGSAPFPDVLAAWSGLGYNRRARYLHRSAGEIVETFGGELPREPTVLQTLPGIGPNTAGSIAAFAWNRPVVFIETNIRRVFLHHFFPEERGVHDREILALVERTLPQTEPRVWYWALMDYGVYLAATEGNANRRSRHYQRQKPFEQSDRQLRGRILRALTRDGGISVAELIPATDFSEERVVAALTALERDDLIRQTPEGGWVIAD